MQAFDLFVSRSKARILVLQRQIACHEAEIRESKKLHKQARIDKKNCSKEIDQLQHIMNNLERVPRMHAAGDS